MFKVIFEKNKIISLFVWSFFCFSVIKCFSVFIYFLTNAFLYQAFLYSILFFIYFFIFKIRFGTRLTYLQYITNSLLFIIGIIIFSYSYFKLVMLDDDHFNIVFFTAIFISNLILTSFLFLLTLIKRK
jgi:hypothetical protein